MKTLFIKLFFIGVGLSFFTSCKKDLPVDTFMGGTAPVLSASVSGTIPLSFANQNNVEVAFSWTNPNYLFTTGVSSQSVSYLLEIDTLGANFSNPNRYQTIISPDLGVVYIDAILNAALTNQMLLAPGIAHTIQVRVTASINSATETKVASNVLQFTVTPWNPPPAVAPPSTYADNPNGTLYIVGSAVGGGWNNPIDPGNVTAQQFTKVSSTLYQITIPIIGDGEYKMIGVNSSWNDQWSVKTEQSSGDPTTLNASLYFNGGNCRAPLASGNYLIVVDFQHGTIKLTKQ